MENIGGFGLTKISHSCFRLAHQQLVIFIDPFRIPVREPADIVCITHDHYDHCSAEDILNIVGPKTVIVAAANCESKLDPFREQGLVVHLVHPGDSLTVRGVPIRAIPAYNLNKFRSPGQLYHPKDAGGLGFILQLGPKTLLHAGDTDATPELKAAKADIALLPVSGTYVMTPDEAAEAANAIGPQLAIPMHYGAIVGSLEQAEKFRKLAKCPVQVMG